VSIKPEFKTGKIVTYKPYEVKHRVKITAVLMRDTHVEYALISAADPRNTQIKKGYGKYFTATLQSTGASIMESKLFNGKA